MEKVPFWNRSTLFVITGASRGIGKNIAIKIGSLVDSNSTFILLARSIQNLTDTKKQILTINPNLDVKTFSVDLSKPNGQEFDDLLTRSIARKKYELYLLIHNAGSIITDVPASKMDDIERFNEYMSLNLYSVTALTASFLKLFSEGERCIVNITSLYGVQPAKGLVHYCIGKASREMYFKVLAEENPSINILMYSPGPIETDMYRQITEDCWHPDSKNLSKTLLLNNQTVKIEDTVQRLVDILQSRSYKYGERIDFYS